MTEYTPERIAELRKIEAAATDAPWSNCGDDSNGQAVICSHGCAEIATFWHHCVKSLEERMRANAEFVATARNEFAGLLDALEAANAVAARRLALLREVAAIANMQRWPRIWPADFGLLDKAKFDDLSRRVLAELGETP